MEEKKSKFIILSILAAIILLLFYYLYSNGFFDLLSLDVNEITSFVGKFGAWSPIIFFLLTILEVIFAPLPGVIFYIAGGILFGTFIGGTIALIGNLIGSVAAFEIARRLGSEFIHEKDKSKQRKRFEEMSSKYGGYAIFFLRINPFTSSDIFSYLAGLSGMKLKNFVIATALALPPLVYLQAYLGEWIILKNKFLLYIFIFVSLLYLVVFTYFIIRFIINKKKAK